MPWLSQLSHWPSYRRLPDAACSQRQLRFHPVKLQLVKGRNLKPAVRFLSPDGRGSIAEGSLRSGSNREAEMSGSGSMALKNVENPGERHSPLRGLNAGKTATRWQ